MLIPAELAAGHARVFNELRQRPRGARRHPSCTSARGPAFALRAAAGKGRIDMLETIAIILIVLWLLGVVSGYTMGNFIYVLLIVAIVLFLVRLIGGRRVV
jgi:uncharacterized protein DUF5670